MKYIICMKIYCNFNIVKFQKTKNFKVSFYKSFYKTYKDAAFERGLEVFNNPAIQVIKLT